MTQMPVDWDNEVVRTYLTPESHQKPREEFERTHIDIDKIKSEYLFPHPSNDDFVTQEEFRDAILKSQIKDDNRIFILRGETGSGKSQLCQWLEYQIGHGRNTGQDETHIALHVSRSQTRIKDIVDILTEPIDVDIQVGNIEDLDPGKVADAMIANLEAYAPTAFQELSESEVQSLIEDRPGTELRSILTENIESYQEAIASEEGNDIPDLINEDDYRDLALSAFGQASGGSTIYPSLRGFLHDELSGKLNVGNFQEKLERISDAYVDAGLRPVLICEDLTTFSVLKEQLLDHIFQLDSGHYDVVLGWTTGWEKDDLDKALGTTENTYTYMKDRAEGYLSTTDETGQAYFLTEDVTVELARKYVSVIRKESEREFDVDIQEGAFDDLYPFNAEFVRRAYDHLVQDGNERRTPRLLLIRIIRECLTSNAPPFESIDGNPYVKPFPTSVAIDLPADVQNLAKWYGRPTAKQNIELPRDIFSTFDVPVPEDVIDSGDPVVLGGNESGLKRDLQLEQIDGTIEPGATITVKTTLNSRPESDAEIELDGEPVGFSDGNGQCEVTLPKEDKDVTITARKADLTDSRTFSVGTDSLNLSPNPSRPDEGEDVTVTARFNGEPVSGVQIHKSDKQVGTTDADGKLTVVADSGPEMTIRGKVDGIEDEETVQVLAAGGNYPVEVDFDPEEVDQQRFEYEQWIKTGEEYSSSDTLKEGAVTVLEKWHDPTRLANANASTTGVAGIYYARGSETPVSIQSVNERQGISIDLLFGTEYNDIYEPLLWCGLSVNDELPREDRYDLNYNLLHGWVDDKVAEFRSEMRDEIETCLPDGWTIEQFIIVSQFLLHNAGKGETDLSRELIFEEFETPNTYSHPMAERFDGHSFREAHNNLTKSSDQPRKLAEGFFKLKQNFVDDQRLSEAYETVANNLDTYIEEAIYIDDDLPDAYRIGTNRSNARTRFEPLLKRVKEYAQELNSLGSDDVAHISEKVENIDAWYDENHSVPELLELYKDLYDSVETMDVGETKWAKQKERLESGDNIRLNEFQQDIAAFREVESMTGPELLKLLHRFEKSRAKRVEWDIYEAIVEMIEAAEGVEVPETTQVLEEAVKQSDEMTELMEIRSSIANSIGGEN